MIKRACLLALVASGCFNFQTDLQTCIDAGRCAAEPSPDGSFVSIRGLGSCNPRGDCWEAPVPTSLELTGAVATSPDDWWFSSSAGAAFHRQPDGGWSMQQVGPTPVLAENEWLRGVGVVACAGTPWVPLRYANVNQRAWTLDGDGGSTNRFELRDKDDNNFATVSATWSAQGQCAWGGSASQSFDRPWLAQSTTTGPRAAWELPETTPGDLVTAIGGTSLDELWLGITGPTWGGIYRHAFDGGFELTFPQPTALSAITGVCLLNNGTVIASGPEGLASADDAGGARFYSGNVRALACFGNSIVAASSGLVICQSTADCVPAAAFGSINFTALGGEGTQLVAVSANGEVADVSSGTLWSKGTLSQLEDVWVGTDGRGAAVGDQLLVRRSPGSGWETRIEGTSLTGANTVRELADGGLMVLGHRLAVWVSPSDTVTNIKLKNAGGMVVQTGLALQINTATQAPDGTWWAVGTAPSDRFLAMHLVGDTLSEVPFDAGQDPVEMYSLTFAPNGEGWAGGREGKIWHYVPAMGWSFQWKAPEHTENFNAALAARGTVWIAGGHGRVAQYADGVWQTRPFPDAQDDVRMLYDSDAGIRAVGSRHRYLLDAEGNWIIQPPLPVDVTRSLTRGAVAGDRGWIVGDRGSVVSFPR